MTKDALPVPPRLKLVTAKLNYDLVLVSDELHYSIHNTLASGRNSVYRYTRDHVHIGAQILKGSNEFSATIFTNTARPLMLMCAFIESDRIISGHYQKFPTKFEHMHVIESK